MHNSSPLRDSAATDSGHTRQTDAHTGTHCVQTHTNAVSFIMPPRTQHGRESEYCCTTWQGSRGRQLATRTRPYHATEQARVSCHSTLAVGRQWVVDALAERLALLECLVVVLEASLVVLATSLRRHHLCRNRHAALKAVATVRVRPRAVALHAPVCDGAYVIIRALSRT